MLTKAKTISISEAGTAQATCGGWLNPAVSTKNMATGYLTSSIQRQGRGESLLSSIITRCPSLMASPTFEAIHEYASFVLHVNVQRSTGSKQFASDQPDPVSKLPGLCVVSAAWWKERITLDTRIISLPKASITY